MRSAFFRSSWLATTGQVLAGLLGGVTFHLIGVPAAWLSGAVIGVVVWHSLGYRANLPAPLANAAMLICGAALGAGITPEALNALGHYPASLLLLIAAVVAVTAGSALFLVRGCGWRTDDAVLASVPGALTTVLAVAADRNADVPRIAIVQSFRLLVLITLLPGLVTLAGGGGGATVVGAGEQSAGPVTLAAILLGGLLVGHVLRRAGIAAPLLLGGMSVSALAHAVGIAEGAVPAPIAMLGFVLIGVFVGERFQALELASLRKLLPAAAGSLAIGMALATAFALIAMGAAGAGAGEALVAFAPGGLEAMMVLAFALGLDPLYVGVHHFARFLSIGFLLPLIYRRSGKRADPA